MNLKFQNIRKQNLKNSSNIYAKIRDFRMFRIIYVSNYLNFLCIVLKEITLLDYFILLVGQMYLSNSYT